MARMANKSDIYDFKFQSKFLINPKATLAVIRYLLKYIPLMSSIIDSGKLSISLLLLLNKALKLLKKTRYTFLIF